MIDAKKYPPEIQWILNRLNPNNALIGFSLLTVASILGSVLLKQSLLMSLPFLVVGLAFVVSNLRGTFLLLIFSLPLSIALEVGGGFSTDLPTEPLMIVLLFCGIAYYLVHPKQFSRKFLLHPIMIFLLLHLLWTAVSMVYSQSFLISFKFLLAKTWYVAAFVFMTALFVKKPKDLKPIVWLILIPFCLVVIRALLEHSASGFGFHEANLTMQPFFRNHVDYAVMMVIFLPYVFFAFRWYEKGTRQYRLLMTCTVILLIGLLFAYTRAAYISLVLMPVAYYIIRKRLIGGLSVIALAVVLLFIAYQASGNRYLELAPDFVNTIYHDNLDDHFFATFEGKDVSSMERVYRWIAALNMAQEHPFVGFGPGCFYSFYKTYTVSSFATYVSDNPERSGVHNYFLMILVEQGLIGLFVFIAFCMVILIKGEQIYHRIQNEESKQLVMVILISLVVVLFNILLSDMIEVDKTGSLFFMALAILVNLDIDEKKPQIQ